MIFVDTSVWVAALRSATGEEARHLGMLLDADEVALAAPVRVEILVGSSIQERPRLHRLLAALPIFYPVGSTWDLIDSWIDAASAAGESFGFAALLIGALAAQQEGAVWSLDSDFKRMAHVGLVKYYLPTGV
ncbi:MAG TPA: PIN domain-containing protein [Thermoanaerobaculia bacterium]|nr:PIN domain-containing protein [Thermoanaerobaculia bacterium]